MTIRETDIEGLVVIEPTIYKDHRGYFFESYNSGVHAEAGLKHTFVQDNQSKSSYGVIRGLHLQAAPHAQTKLVRVLEGAIYDVAVDLRKGSLSYGKWFGIEINEENNFQLLIPKGFAHGFSVLSETATVFYKCDELYHPESEIGIMFNDTELAIDWKIPEDKVSVSEKDTILPSFNTFLG
jgi:dTDP-4-dehydrorhamnose 3,5-epimerase